MLHAIIIVLLPRDQLLINLVIINFNLLSITAVPYPPPDKPSLSIVDLGLRWITFTWSPVAPDCPAIHYNILASNCGSCPTTTNHTTVTCTDVPVEHDGDACTFSLEAVVCESVTGNVSNTAQGLFKGTLLACLINLNKGHHALTYFSYYS